MNIPFFNKLEGAKNILIAGTGGGFDIFCGLPLYFVLKQAGKTVHLANLSSGALGFCDAENPAPALSRITAPDCRNQVFPGDAPFCMADGTLRRDPHLCH
ncbi:MAG: hypothetical protein QM813_24930 [Verrucomicrobiota bacterium]